MYPPSSAAHGAAAGRTSVPARASLRWRHSRNAVQAASVGHSSWKTFQLTTGPAVSVIGASARLGNGMPAPRRSAWALRALLIYAVLSLALFGLPVLGHFGSHIIAYDELDPSFLMWMLAWRR